MTKVCCWEILSFSIHHIKWLNSTVNTLATSYIHNKPLKVVDQHSHLGVTLHKSISLNHHIHIITNKATTELSFIKCILSKYSSDCMGQINFIIIIIYNICATVIWDHINNSWLKKYISQWKSIAIMQSSRMG